MNDDGGIILGWLFKLLVGLAIFAVVAFEAGSVIIVRVQVDGIAADAANEAGGEYASSRSPDRAEQVAAAVAARGDASIVAFDVSSDGRTVSVTVEKRAKTLIIHRIASLRRFLVARATHEAPVR